MNKPPERPISTMHPAADERNGKDVDMNLCKKRRYSFYSYDRKTEFFHLFFSKWASTSAAAKQLGIHVRVARRWVKRYGEDPESILEKKKKSDCHRILGEEHEHFLLNYIDENPFVVLTDGAFIAGFCRSQLFLVVLFTTL